MSHIKRWRAPACCAAALLLSVPSTAAAQQYPTRPLLIVAPFPAGGDSDLAARNVAAVVPKYLKQNAVVLNKVGAIRKNPGKLKYSTAGVGTIHEMGPQMLFDAQKLGKDAALQIPYKGGGDAATALIGRHVDFSCSNIGTVLGFIKNRQLRALLTTTPERYKEIPDVPTAKEAGFPMLERIIGWSALYGPPKMDARLVKIWGDTLQKVAKDPQWVGATEKIGSVPHILPPQETARFVKEQYETYYNLGKLLNIVLK